MRKKIIIAVLAALVFGGAAYFVWGRNGGLPYEFIVAEKSDLIQEVSVTGRVKPGQDISLAFERGGKISRVYVDVGSRVYAGQLLASLNSAELQAQIASAEADIKAQEAKLAELQKGTRPEEINVYEIKAANAQTDLITSKQDLLDKLQDAYTKSDDAVRNKADQFFNNPRSSDPTLKFILTDRQLESDIKWRRFLLENTFASWKLGLDRLDARSDLLSFTITAKQDLAEVKNFLDKVALGVNSLTASADFSQTVVDGYKTDVATARTNLNTATVNLSASEEGVKSAQAALTLSQQELELKKAGTIEEQINAQEAAVEKAKAQKNQYQAQLSEMIIFSPINGVVVKKDLEIGEIISANTEVFSVISDSKLGVETNIPEADIAKIKIGDSAEITLDTYGDDVIFGARVASIDPAETIIEGVATYKTKLQFLSNDDRVKPGMTANVDILAKELGGVIAVPYRAVISRDGGKFVRLVDANGNISEKEVKIGLRGSDGNIEITEGVSEGDKVVTLLK